MKKVQLLIALAFCFACSWKPDSQTMGLTLTLTVCTFLPAFGAVWAADRRPHWFGFWLGCLGPQGARILFGGVDGGTPTVATLAIVCAFVALAYTGLELRTRGDFMGPEEAEPPLPPRQHTSLGTHVEPDAIERAIAGQTKPDWN